MSALHFLAALVDQTGFSFPELARELAAHAVDRDMQIVCRFLRINVLSGDREMHFGTEAFLGINGIIMNQHDMCSDDFGKIFEFADDTGDMLMERCGKTEMTRAKMDLHGSR